ncbi:hypothetical protein ACIBEJ_33125 [Nonomuraea sp. NPDC050790]|uniref:hypothetical protein n=1 Tax=Nonomuraea sp. NPDC050790 TaxID=3364371 RepID=UPI00378CB583
MKEFQLIDEVMPDVPPADPARAMAARGRMLGGPRRRELPGWSRMALAAAAVTVLVGGGFAVAPMLSESRVGTAAPAPGPAEALGAAADRLAAQPPGEGDWWRRDLVRVIRLPGRTTPAYTVEYRIEEVLWVDRDGRKRQDRGEITAKPLTPADEQAWKEAGSPDLCPEDCQIGRTYFIPTAMTPVSKLPAEAEALKAEMLRHLPADGTSTEESWLWTTAKWMLLDTESSPATRAALYRVLAGLPGVQVADGRTGIALEYDNQRFVIDRDTGALLAVADGETSYLVKRMGWTGEQPRS